VDFQHLRRSWEVFATDDPLFAIVTAPGKNGNRWDPDEFFELGRREVQDVFAALGRHGLDPPRSRALDFGCGVGRLTRFFADHFETAIGVDVSSRMVELARGYAPGPGGPVYAHNPRPDLALFADGTFDLVFSTLVLQHMRPDYAMGYVAEFVRLLSPEGVAMFSLPNRGPDPEPSAVPAPVDPRPAALVSRLRHSAARGVTSARELVGAAVRRVEGALHGVPEGPAPPVLPEAAEHYRSTATMEMFAVPVDRVVATICGAGGAVAAVDDLPFVPGYEAKVYYATRLGT
jgi:SAM-dependent methyltransferase